METRAQLSGALSALRQRSGYSVRELAGRLDIPVSTLGGYLTGRHLPSASQLMTYTALLRECGITDPAEIERWVAALTRARAASDGRTARGETPYRGLEPFGAGDAKWFFGRDEMLRVLVSRIAEVRADPYRPRVIPLVGASGAGKSSLLNAGLLAAVERGDVDGVRTAATLVDANRPAGLPDLVVIDRFDEHLAHAAEVLAGLGDAIVVIGLRADYYADALEVEVLVPALQRNQVLVTALTRDELRTVIVEPAARAGATVEPALVDLVLADLRVDGREHDPGALPLLSHALLATWVRATRRHLSVADYRAVGGILGAVQQTAEDVWADLDAEDQQLARQLFLRLVTIGDDTATLTRRRIDRAEIDGASAAAVTALVDTFVARRLLTVDFDVVQISHEALLTAWPRLRAWIDDDRASLRLHRRLTDATNQWAAAGRDPELLLTGSRLTAIADWAAEPNHAGSLNRVEAEFLEASTRAATARREAEHRQNQRLKRLLAVVAVLSVVAVVLAGIALYARSVADRQRSEANQARDEALSRQVEVEVAELLPKDPGLAAQLAATEYRIAPTADARSALLSATGVRMPTRLIVSGQPMQAVAVHGDVLAADGADGKVHLWQLQGTGTPKPLAPALTASKPGTLYALAISPDGTTLAAAGGDRVIDLWSLPSMRHLATLTGFDNTIYSLAFSPDGHILAAGGAAGTDAGAVRRFAMQDPAHPAALPVLDEPDGFVQALSFDASGGRLAYGTKQGDLVLYRDAGSARATLTARHAVGNGHALYAVAFDPDREVVATGGDDRTLRQWRVDGSGRLALNTTTGGFTSWINGISWDRSGNLYAASSDDRVHIIVGKAVTLLPQPEPVTAVAVSGDRIVTAGIDGAVRIWPTTAPTLRASRDTVFSLGYADNGLLAAGSADGHVALWRAHHLLSDSIAAPGRDAIDGASAISPDGTLVAGGTSGGRTVLWSVRDPSRPQYLGVLPGTETGGETTVEGLAFSPDSHLLAAGGDDRTVRLWSVADPQNPRVIGIMRTARNYVFSVAFSHDGRYLAAASADRHAYVWSLSGHPRLLGSVSGFASYAYAVAFAPTRDVLAVGSADSTVRLLDVHSSGAPTRSGGPLTGATDSIYALAFNPAGTMLAGASRDGSAYLWDVATHRRLAALQGGSGLSAIGFDPTGAIIAAAGTDHDVHLWRASASAAVRMICAHAGTPLTRAEWRRYVPGAPYDPVCR